MMTCGEAIQDPTTRLGAAYVASKQERDKAIAAYMAQGMTLEQAALAWAKALFA